MKTNTDISKLPFSITTEKEFNDKCIEIFHFQYKNNVVYQQYVNALGVSVNSIDNYQDIPFLPIQFFKSQEVICRPNTVQKIFKSSGTGGDRSNHFVADLSIYETSFINCFNQYFGSPEDYTVIALLPNYIEQGDSSLVYMVNELIKLSNNENSGYYLDDINQLGVLVKELEPQKKVLIIGVTYALLDFAEVNKEKFTNTVVIETGGMKGRRKELVREELHEILTKSFGVKHIFSEYGMTELLSQAYLMGNGRFAAPPWMKVLLRDVNDPLSIREKGRGGINVIDLANINSCSFLATQDLGKLYEDGSFEVLGRFDNSDVRGCNLLVI